MNASRNRVKAQNRELNSQLQASEEAAKKRNRQRVFRKKHSEILFGLGNLIFGGAIIGGLFQEQISPLPLYIGASVAFCLVMGWGYYFYGKSINE